MKKLYIETYGCQMNVADSDQSKGQFDPLIAFVLQK